CRRADLLIIPFPRPKGCNPPGEVIDFFAVRDRGTHAIYIEDGEVSVTTVAEFRGIRPWSIPPQRRWRAARAGRSRKVSRLKGFAAPSDLPMLSRRVGLDIDEDDDPVVSRLADRIEEQN